MCNLIIWLLLIDKLYLVEYFCCCAIRYKATDESFWFIRHIDRKIHRIFQNESMDEIQHGKWDYARQSNTHWSIHYSYLVFGVFFWQYFSVCLTRSFSHAVWPHSMCTHISHYACIYIDICTVYAPYIFITKVHNQQKKRAHSTIIACYSFI